MENIGRYSINKYCTILFGVLLLSNQANAQITLDKEIDSIFLAYQFKTVQISPTETKYLFEDTIVNTFSLYNMDFTPFILNISVPAPFAISSSSRFDVLYVTRSLFDCDSTNIEYAYTSPSDNNKPFRVLRTDGTLLFQMDSANAPYCFGDCGLGGSDVVRPIVNTSAGAKLFLQKYNLGYEQIFIYSLCGLLPTDIFNFTELTKSYVRIFPNPTTGSLSFQINRPDNTNEYEIVILDNGLKEVMREKVNLWNDIYYFDFRNFSSGTYYYSLTSKSKSYQSGKFLLTK